MRAPPVCRDVCNPGSASKPQPDTPIRSRTADSRLRGVTRAQDREGGGNSQVQALLPAALESPWPHGHGRDLGAEDPLCTWAVTPETLACSLLRALKGAQAAGLGAATMEEPHAPHPHSAVQRWWAPSRERVHTRAPRATRGVAHRRIRLWLHKYRGDKHRSRSSNHSKGRPFLQGQRRQ